MNCVIRTTRENKKNKKNEDKNLPGEGNRWDDLTEVRRSSRRRERNKGRRGRRRWLVVAAGKSKVDGFCRDST